MAGELFGVIARFAFGPQRPGPGLDPAVIVTNETGDGLRIDWDVQKTSTSAPDTATIQVFNLLPAYRTALGRLGSLQGRIRVQLAIGWRGANVPATAVRPMTPADVLFTGEDWLVKAEERNGMDVVTTLECGDGLQPSDAGPQGGSEAKLAVDLLLGLHLGQLQVTPSKAALAHIAERATALGIGPIQNSWDWPPREAIDALMDSLGLGWSIVGGEFVVFRGGLRDDLPPVILAPQSGLTRWSVIDDGGVEFEALAQPRVAPGCAVSFLDHLGVVVGGAPQLRVDHIRFRGSTEGVSIMAGTARPVRVF